jgi:hypothetical protein
MNRGSPKFDLADVKRLAVAYLNGEKAADGKRTVRFTAPSRSTEAVVAALLCAQVVANRKIATGLLALHSKDFYGRKLQWGDVYDEYGLENYEGHNWYVKYCLVTEDCGAEYIEEVSFHPVKKQMALKDGRTLKVTYQVSNERG